MFSKATGVIITTMKLKIQLALKANSSAQAFQISILIGDGLPRSQGISWCTDSQWDNFCRIKPSHSKPANGKERVEHEKEYRLSNTSLFVVQVNQSVVSSREHSH